MSYFPTGPIYLLVYVIIFVIIILVLLHLLGHIWAIIPVSKAIIQHEESILSLPGMAQQQIYSTRILP